MPGPRRVQMNREQGGVSARALGKAAVITGEPREPAQSKARPNETKGRFIYAPPPPRRSLRWATGAGTRMPALRLVPREAPPLGPQPQAVLPRGKPDRSQINPGTKSVTRGGAGGWWWCSHCVHPVHRRETPSGSFLYGILWEWNFPADVAVFD